MLIVKCADVVVWYLGAGGEGLLVLRGLWSRAG